MAPPTRWAAKRNAPSACLGVPRPRWREDDDGVAPTSLHLRECGGFSRSRDRRVLSRPSGREIVISASPLFLSLHTSREMRDTRSDGESGPRPRSSHFDATSNALRGLALALSTFSRFAKFSSLRVFERARWARGRTPQLWRRPNAEITRRRAHPSSRRDYAQWAKARWDDAMAAWARQSAIILLFRAALSPSPRIRRIIHFNSVRAGARVRDASDAGSRKMRITKKKMKSKTKKEVASRLVSASSRCCPKADGTRE